MVKARLLLISPFLLPLLRIPTANLTDAPTEFVTPVNAVKPEDMDAVGGNISAYYIVRAITHRAAILGYSMNWAKKDIDDVHKVRLEKAMEKVPALVKQLNETKQKVNMFTDQLKNAEERDVLAEDQLNTANKRVKQVDQELTEARASEKEEEEMTKEHHAFWLLELEHSKLTIPEMTMLTKDLARVLKGDIDKETYLKAVNELIEKFTQKVEKFEEDKKAWGTYVEEEEAEHEDKELEAFHENTIKLNELKAENIKKNAKKRIRPKKAKAAQDRFKINDEIIASLMQLNTIGKNLFVNQMAIEKFHNEQKHLRVYVKSILEVAEKAAAESKFHYYAGQRKGNWTQLLEGLMEMWYHATHLLIPEMSLQLKEIYTDDIHSKIEMPNRWFFKKAEEAKAHPPLNAQGKHDELAEAIVNMSARIDVLLAKRLLVYYRLNRFYMVDQYHTICVDQQYQHYPKENSTYRLLDSLCHKFNVQNGK